MDGELRIHAKLLDKWLNHSREGMLVSIFSRAATSDGFVVL